MTWYTNKTKKEAVTGSYGAWLAPDGTITPVDYQEHSWVAGKILGEKFNTFKAEENLLNSGYVAITFHGGFAIRHRKGLSDEQLKRILNLYKSKKGSSLTIDTPSGMRYINDPQELFFALTDNKVTEADLNYKILKRATGVYGHWISPNGQTIEIPSYQGHLESAKNIIKDLDIDISESQNPSESLNELGWMRTAYDSSEMVISSKATPTGPQSETAQKLAQMAPKRIDLILVEIPSKTRYIMRNQIGKLAKYLQSDEARIWADKKDKIIKTSHGKTTIKTAKVDMSEFEDFLKGSDRIEVNPKNQIGNNSNFYDVQRYVMDSYATKTSISKTKSKITVSILTTHGFLGSVAFNKYWTFQFEEWKDSIKLYKDVNKIVQETIEEFIEEEITSTVFWPILKFKLDKLQPEKNTATNIPWVNYSRYYTDQEEPDWRKNIYGPRYPSYSEPSYDQEIRRKGVFFD